MLWPLPHRSVLHNLPAFPGLSCGVSVPALCWLLLNLSPSAKTKPPEQPASPQCSSADAGENLSSKKWACGEAQDSVEGQAGAGAQGAHAGPPVTICAGQDTPTPESEAPLLGPCRQGHTPNPVATSGLGAQRVAHLPKRDSPEMSLWSLRGTRDLRQAPHQALGPADLGIDTF